MKLDKIVDMVPRLALIGACACALVIAFLSLLPGDDLPSQNLNDKLNHFIAYGVLMGLAVLGRGARSLLWTGLLVAGYGLLLEGLQGVMPFGRSASLLDAIANTGGVLIGTLAGLCAQAVIRRLARR
ncbi:MAG: VanZ family protein [Hyphomonadaceae bacterium]